MRAYIAPIAILLVGGGTIAAVANTWSLGPLGGGPRWTDNAYVKGDIVTLSPRVTGFVSEVAVKDFQPVKSGDLLLRLDDRDYLARVARAEATLAAARAGITANNERQALQAFTILAASADLDGAKARYTKAKLDHDRAVYLEERGAGSGSKLEQSQADLDQALAVVARAEAANKQSAEQKMALTIEREQLLAAAQQAEADVNLAKIDLDSTEIRSPIDGVTGERQVHPGQYVKPGTQLVAVVPREGLWIIANFKESQLSALSVGDRVTAAVDAIGGAKVSGHIESFSPASGADFALIPPDNATANFTKIARRYGVRIALDDLGEAKQKLSPGMSVEVTVAAPKGEGAK